MKKLRYVLIALAAASLAACGSHSSQDPALQNADNNAATAAAQALDPFNPDSQLGINHNYVLFATNVYQVDSQYFDLLKANADYLMAHPNQKVQIQGRTDERGSVEYNLALGQRRAVAVQKILVQYGVNPTQLSTISYGKSRPIVLGTGPAVWAQNRRASVVYLPEAAAPAQP